MDGAMGEYLGHLLAFSGDWEYGGTVGARARDLNPHHPVWYWALPLLDAFRKGDYQGARTYALKVERQPLWLTKAIIASLDGQLGQLEAGQKSVDELLLLEPDSAAFAREEFSKWYPAELVESLMDGLRKSGLFTSANLP
jgi:adenylate cyclase